MYRCPFPECAYRNADRAEVERHLKQDKSKKIDLGTLLVQSVDAPTLAYCEICEIKYPSTLVFQHEGGRKHTTNLLASTYNLNK